MFLQAFRDVCRTMFSEKGDQLLGSEAGPRTRKGRRKGWTEQQSPLFYRFVHVVMGLFIRAWVRSYRFVGVENVPRNGGAFLIANHVSGMDPFMLAYPIQHRLLRGPGKKELFQNPVFGYLMRKVGIFPLRQSVKDSSAVRTMVELYRHGRVVIVYPEGGRSESGELRPFYPDFARLVIKLKAPVIPAGLAGTRELLPIGSRIPRFHSPVVVAYGEPFELWQFYDCDLTPQVAQEASNILHARVTDLIAQARIERAKLLGTASSP